MPYATFDEAVLAAAHEAALLVASKQRDYGPNNIMKSVVGPELGIAVRLNDKIARLANLKMHDATPENEALRRRCLRPARRYRPLHTKSKEPPVPTAREQNAR